MRENELDLGLRLLDDQLVDADGIRRGRVDDIELEGGPGAETRVAALLVGAAAWPARVPRRIRGIAAGLTPGAMVAVPFSEVDDVTTTVKLRRRGPELGLDVDDGSHARWRGAPPPGTLRLSSLIGAQAVGPFGTPLGRIYEVRARRDRLPVDGRVREPWIVTGLLVGRRSLAQRLGLTAADRGAGGDGAPPPDLVPWERVTEVGEGVVVCGG